MRRTAYPLAIAAIAIALTSTACGKPSDSASTTTETKTVTESATTSATTSAASTPATPGASATTRAGGSADLFGLIPTAPNTRRTEGPNVIAEDGIHEYFEVTGSPADAMNAYKTVLEGKGWTLTVWNSGGGGNGGGGGATYSGTNGDVYGVFTGGGYGDTTHIQACAWPSKPVNPDCGEQN